MLMITNVYSSLPYPTWISWHSVPRLHLETGLMTLPLPGTFPVTETEGNVPSVTSAYFL